MFEILYNDKCESIDLKHKNILTLKKLLENYKNYEYRLQDLLPSGLKLNKGRGHYNLLINNLIINWEEMR